MKRFLKRLAAYLFALFLLFGIFHYPETTDGPIALQLGYYAVVLGVPALLWIALCEGFYHAFRTKKPAVRDTQPLAPIPDRDTKPLDRK